MFEDLRHAIRGLTRHPRFTFVAMVTLALGIGSAAAIFSVTDWMLFRARRFPSNVFLVGGQGEQQAFLPYRYGFMVDAYQQQVGVVDEWCLTAYRSGNVVVNGEPVATSWLGTNANVFSIFGAAMEQGRGFLPGEDGKAPAPVAVVSDNFWRRRLGTRENVIGSRIEVGGTICTIVGVVRAWQVLPGYFASDIYRPDALQMDPTRPWAFNPMPLVRLRPGVSREAATAAFRAAKVEVPASMRKWMDRDRPALGSMTELGRNERVEVYWVLVGAVGFLYGIACLNASNLILLRMLGQRRDLCIRLAVGCGRSRLIRFLILQNGVLTAGAAIGGTLIANWIFPLLLRVTGNRAISGNWYAWSLDNRVLVVLAGLTALTSLLIVTIPAWRVLRADISSGLKEGGAALGESRSIARVRGAFVMLQAGFAVVLLVGAGLMVRTFHRLQEVDLGFDITRRIKLDGGFPVEIAQSPEARLVRLHEICAHLRLLPGVAAAAFDSNLLLPGYHYTSTEVAGPGGKSVPVSVGMFSLGYQDVGGLELKRGRWLDHPSGSEVMINETLARTCWPDKDPVGQILHPVDQKGAAPPNSGGWQVIGVVRDFRSNLRESPQSWVLGPETWGAMNINTCIIRLSRDYDEALGGAIRRDLFAFEPRMIVSQITPLGELRDQQLWFEHMADSALKVLAAIALLLTVVGLFAVVAYSVDLRMPEFGVRVALGAEGRDIVRLVLRRGLSLTLPGLALGVGVSLGLSRYLRSVLYEISGQDPLVLATVGAALVIVAIAACLVPARRAARVDVARLLRSE